LPAAAAARSHAARSLAPSLPGGLALFVVQVAAVVVVELRFGGNLRQASALRDVGVERCLEAPRHFQLRGPKEHNNNNNNNAHTRSARAPKNESYGVSEALRSGSVGERFSSLRARPRISEKENE
jgi:hypothetical protein